MIRLEAVSKRYGARTAVDALTFDVGRGELFGLLGPNGAGKTTTVSLCCGLLAPDDGRVEIGGRGAPVDAKVRSCVGLAPQALALYELLSGTENLRFFGELQGLRGARLAERVAWALDFVGLADRAKGRLSTYSGGMKRRLNLAAALLHDPEVLFLDEPTVGVDPQSRNALFDNILALRKKGTTILYTTHYMEEVERLCDRVAILDHGRLLALDSVAGLIADHGVLPVLVLETQGGEERVATPDPLAELLRRSAGSGSAALRAFRVERPTLEQVFLQLTGHSLRD
jgi:ABC-2 type transport system ATP-binding protein